MRIQAHWYFYIMFDLVMLEIPPSNSFLKELAHIFPNSKDLPLIHKLFDKNKYTIPGKVICDMVDIGV